MKKLTSDSLLLDTCALLWLAHADPRLSDSCVVEIENAAARQRLYLSVMSLWELGYLVKKNAITLKIPLREFWANCLETLCAKEISLTSEIVHAFHDLPGNFHPDPGDRFLVATALKKQLSIVTSDLKIQTWSRENNIRCVATQK